MVRHRLASEAAAQNQLPAPARYRAGTGPSKPILTPCSCTCSLPGDFVPQHSVVAERHHFLRLSLIFPCLSGTSKLLSSALIIPLAVPISRDVHSHSCSSSQLSLLSAHLQSTCFCLQRKQPSGITQRTRTHFPLGDPTSAAEQQSISHVPLCQEEERGGFALYHWLPVPSIYLFLMKGSCRTAWDSAWWGRGTGPWSHCPCMLSACVAGMAEMQPGSRAPQHPLMRTRRGCNFSPDWPLYVRSSCAPL